MNVRKLAGRRKCGFDRRAEIDPDHVNRSPPGRQLRVTTLAASSFEHDLIFEKLRCDGSNPGQKLLLIPFISLSEVLPLPAKTRRSGGSIFGDSFDCGKARHAADDGPGARTRGAGELTGQNLFGFTLSCGSKNDRPAARWTRQVLKQTSFQDKILSHN